MFLVEVISCLRAATINIAAALISCWDGPSAAVIHLTALVLCVVYGVRVRVRPSPPQKYLSRQSRKRLRAFISAASSQTYELRRAEKG